MDNSKFSLGERIRFRRQQQGFSQEELAEKLYVTRQLVSQYENDKVDISVSALMEVAKVLDVSPAWFFDDAWNKDTREAALDALRGAHIMAMYNTMPRFMQEVAEEQMLALATFIVKLQMSMKK